MSHGSEDRFFVEAAQIPSLDGDEMQRAKKIRPLATSGSVRPYRKLAGGVDLRRWSKRTVASPPSLSPEGSSPGYLPE